MYCIFTCIIKELVLQEKIMSHWLNQVSASMNTDNFRNNLKGILKMYKRYSHNFCFPTTPTKWCVSDASSSSKKDRDCVMSISWVRLFQSRRYQFKSFELLLIYIKNTFTLNTEHYWLQDFYGMNVIITHMTFTWKNWIYSIFYSRCYIIQHSTALAIHVDTSIHFWPTTFLDTIMVTFQSVTLNCALFWHLVRL